MTTQDQINIMTAYVNGKPVERKHKKSSTWALIPNDEEFLWCFRHYEYRIRSVELVPGRKYQSSRWGVTGEFICMHDDRYLFMSNDLPGSYNYWYAKELPTDIALYKMAE